MTVSSWLRWAFTALSDVVAQFYAYLSGCMFNDPVGMAIYAELHYMMSSLMLGEWPAPYLLWPQLSPLYGSAFPVQGQPVPHR